jgi:hypothetical protein
MLFGRATYSLVPEAQFGRELDDLWTHSYVQTILRFKNAFLYFRPEAKILIGSLERYHREATQSLLAQLDVTKFYQNKVRAACTLAAQYHSILSLKHLDTVDLSAVEHLRSALQSRLTFLFGVLSIRSSDFKETIEDSISSQAALFQLIQKIDESVTLSHPAGFRLGKQHMDNSSWYLPCPILNATQQATKRSTRRPPCFCSWALDWLPIACLQCLEYDTETFTRGLHDAEHFLHSLGRGVETWFQTLAKAPRGLFESVTNTLRYTAITSFRVFFDCLSLTYASEKCRWGKLEHQASGHIAQYDVMLHQVICTAMELADRFIAWVLEEESMPITGNFEPGLVDDWFCEQGYERAMRELFLDHVRAFTAKVYSPFAKNPPVRSIEAYRRGEK